VTGIRPGQPGVRRTRRVRTPTILQLEAVECGAAALAIVLAHHGRWIPLDQLRLECGVSRDGSKASNVVRAARGHGLEGRGFRREPGALLDMPLPLIVFWNFNHFVVVEGFSADRVYLNDPATGRRTVDWDEFDLSFTGVVLSFEKTADFQTAGRPPRIGAALAARLRPFRGAFHALVVVGLMLALPGIAIPAFSRIFVDEILVAGRQSWLLPLVIGMSFTALLRAGLLVVQKQLLLSLETALTVTSAADLFWRLLRLPIEFYTQRYAGEVGSRLVTNNRVASTVAVDLPATVLNIATACFFLAVMAHYDLVLTLISLAFALANVALLQAVSRRRQAASQRLSIDEGKLVGVAMSGLTLIESMKASGAENDFFERWAGHQARWLTAMQEQARSSLLLNALPMTFAAMEAALIVGIGGQRVIDGAMTLGMLVAFQSLAQSFAEPVRALVGIGARLQQLPGDISRLDDILKVPLDPHGEGVGPATAYCDGPRLQGRIELRQVTFGYSRTEPALITDLSLTLEPGQRVALVGASGCGKSTVAKLLTGLYQPWSGEVLIDGRPRQAWDRALLAASMTAVDQDIVLFEGTIRENLSLWDDAIDEGALVRAAVDACIHDVIAGRPGGYDAVIGHDGREFSGGERQRLEIARALAGDPRLLVLDEATSALDPLLEREIDLRLRARGCTSLVIAHRLSTVRDCDCIHVMDRGRIVESGRHDQLMAIPDGFYRRLVAST
jgi:NHLM bacteriocin system ABC transporter peptidase/ATP-binding protein